MLIITREKNKNNTNYLFGGPWNQF